MKRTSVIPLTIICILFFTGASYAQGYPKKFSLKLSGGYGNTMGGDMEAFIDGLNSETTDLAAVLGFTQTGELENVNWGLDFEGEFVLNLTENFGIGFGVGCLERKSKSQAELEFLPLIKASISWEPKYTAIPLYLSGYCYFPVAQKMNVFLKAGVGYYFAKIRYEVLEENESLGYPGTWNRDEGEATDERIGFHGGFGFEYDITENIALYIEGTRRYVTFKNWKVKNTETDSSGAEVNQSGTFWYVKEFKEETGKHYASMMISENKPSYPWLKDIRRAEISLSGFSFRVGVKIRFGE